MLSCMCCVFLWKRRQANRAKMLEAKRLADAEEAELQKGCPIVNPRLRLLVERIECKP